MNITFSSEDYWNMDRVIASAITQCLQNFICSNRMSYFGNCNTPEEAEAILKRMQAGWASYADDDSYNWDYKKDDPRYIEWQACKQLFFEYLEGIWD